MNLSNNDKIKIARTTIIVSVAFAMMMAMLLIVNFVQSKLNNPIDNKTIVALVNRLNDSPNNEELKAEIRAFDLMARKAYFTNQWQLRTGCYLMFLAIILATLAARFSLSLRNRLNDIDLIEKNNNFDKIIAQRWIIYSGLAIIVLASVFGFLSYNSLNSFDINTKENLIVEINPTDSLSEISDRHIILVDSVKTKADTLKTDSAKVDSAKVVALTEFPTRAEMKANYPFFRGADADGISFQKNTPTVWDGASGKNIVWKVKIPKSGFSSPIIWDNNIIVTGADAQARMVYCYNRTNGKLLWEAAADNIAGSPEKTPKVTNDTGLAASSPATNGRAIFAIFATGDVIALDMSGKRLWAKNLGLPDNHYGHSSSLVIYKDKLIVQFDTNKSGKLFALSTKTGEVVWSVNRTSKISWSSPILVNTGKRNELILTTNPNVNSYDPQTGKELWSIACLSGEVGPSAAYSDGMVFAANEYAKLVGIKIGETAEVAWESDEFLPEASSPLAINGLLFVATSYGVFACFDAKTGAKYWSQEFGDGFYSSPIYADGKVYATDMAGKTHIVKSSKEYEPIATSPLGEKCVCTPVFQNGKMYLRGYNNLYCIGK